MGGYLRQVVGDGKGTKPPLDLIEDVLERIIRCESTDMLRAARALCDDRLPPFSIPTALLGQGNRTNMIQQLLELGAELDQSSLCGIIKGILNGTLAHYLLAPAMRNLLLKDQWIDTRQLELLM